MAVNTQQLIREHERALARIAELEAALRELLEDYEDAREEWGGPDVIEKADRLISQARAALEGKG